MVMETLEQVGSVADMRCGKDKLVQQETKVLLQERKIYPNVISIVVVEAEGQGQSNSIYADYDPTYLTSTDRISPLWHIA